MLLKLSSGADTRRLVLRRDERPFEALAAHASQAFGDTPAAASAGGRALRRFEFQDAEGDACVLGAWPRAATPCSFHGGADPGLGCRAAQRATRTCGRLCATAPSGGRCSRSS